MKIKLFPLGILSLLASLSLLPRQAIAREILTSSQVYGLHRTVSLHRFQEKKPKPATLGATLYPKDMVRTGADSWAKLLFNEGTLLRLDPQNVFRFVPNTLSFELKHGVILSMIHPGRGMTTILTPESNVIAMGTALIVHHNSQTQDTRVGVLTENNGNSVYVTSPDGQGRVRLGTGDLVTIQSGVIGPVESFDLTGFYAACPISDGLAPEEGEAISTEPTETQATWQLIRAETQDGLQRQAAQQIQADDTGSSLCEAVSEAPKEKLQKSRPRFNLGFRTGGGSESGGGIPGGPRVPGRP